MPKDQKPQEKTVFIRIEWIIMGILIILLILSLVTKGFSQLPFNLQIPFLGSIRGQSVLNPDEIKEKVISYVGEEILQGQGDVEVSDIIEDPESDLYKIKLLIGGQEFESFVSKDGKYLYTERREIVQPEEQLADYPKQDTPEVLLFTMSYCPYGNQAEDVVKPVYDLLSNDVNIQPHYVIYNEGYGYEGSEYCLDEGNQYCSMHGIQELNQGIRELCTFKYQNDKFWDFVFAANEKCDSSNVDECWEQVAKDLGIDTEQIKTCQANESISILEKEVELNQQYQVTGSPTIIINGKNYEGNRTPEDLKKAICSSFNNEPGICSQELDSSGSAPEGSCD
jgi:glutaredoxin